MQATKKPKGFLQPREKSPIVAACPLLEVMKEWTSGAGFV
jgi:hypothetical protein